MTRTKWGLLLVLLAVMAAGLYAYVQHEAAYPGTSDAYITAHVIRIEPQIGGRVIALAVKDHQAVTQGQLLIKIDDHPYRIAMQRAQAELVLTRQQALAADAAVQAASATINQQQAQLDNIQRNYKRDTRLLASKAVSQAQADSDQDKLHELTAALAVGQADYNRVLSEQEAAGARISVARAALAQARLNLSYTIIKAPASGVLGRIRLRPGDLLQAGQQLFPLVEDKIFWVSANYKETELARIRPGQPATISVDMYPGKVFHGVVDSLSPASGVAFSLLPPENATGNWVKVTQRFSVRVRVITHDSNTPLRVGTSCSVTINTTVSPKADRLAENQPVSGDGQ